MKLFTFIYHYSYKIDISLCWIVLYIKLLSTSDLISTDIVLLDGLELNSLTDLLNVLLNLLFEPWILILFDV